MMAMEMATKAEDLPAGTAAGMGGMPPMAFEDIGDMVGMPDDDPHAMDDMGPPNML